MKKLLCIILLYIPLYIHLAFADNNMILNVKQAKQTCQCSNCNLANSNFTQFKPGSDNATENTFAEKSATQNSQDCWLSCNFQQANLTNANFDNTDFRTCVRGYVSPLASADFSNANFSNASLKQAQFYGTKFYAVNFSKANLENAALSLSIFQNTNFSKANLNHTVAQIDAMHGWGVDMRDANFTDANLSFASLHGNFQGANFTHANLKNIELSTSLDAVPMANNIKTSADLWKHTNFSNANLRGAKIVDSSGDKIDLSKAIFCHTIMPDGKINNRNCK